MGKVDNQFACPYCARSFPKHHALQQHLTLAASCARKRHAQLQRAAAGISPPNPSQPTPATTPELEDMFIDVEVEVDAEEDRLQPQDEEMKNSIAIPSSSQTPEPQQHARRVTVEEVEDEQSGNGSVCD